MQADAGLAQAGPEDAHGAVGARGDVHGRGIVPALTFFEELFVVSKIGRGGHVDDLPLAVRDELRLAGRDGKSGDHVLAVIVDRAHAFGGVDHDDVVAQDGVFLEPLVLLHQLDFEGVDAGHLHDVARLELGRVQAGIGLLQEGLVGVEALGHQFIHAAVEHGLVVLPKLRVFRQFAIDVGLHFLAHGVVGQGDGHLGFSGADDRLPVIDFLVAVGVVPVHHSLVAELAEHAVDLARCEQLFIKEDLHAQDGVFVGRHMMAQAFRAVIALASRLVLGGKSQ